jgi:hypothetical protein
VVCFGGGRGRSYYQRVKVINRLFERGTEAVGVGCGISSLKDRSTMGEKFESEGRGVEEAK